MKYLHCVLVLATVSLGYFGAGCSSTATSPLPVVPPAPAPLVSLDSYLQTDYAPADGFDFAFGNADGKGAYTDLATGKTYDGWYLATKFAEVYSLGLHPGEDWNGTGGKDTDLGQPVYAVANGRVVFASNCGRLWGNVVVIEHTFYENYEKKKIRSLYAHLLEINTRVGEGVKRRQRIAAIGQDPEKNYNPHLHLELRWDDLSPTYWPSSNGKDQAWVREHYAEPSSFIAAHRQLFVPQQEATLVLVEQSSYKMRLYQQGKMQGEYHVSFGQAQGQKRVQGDNKTPKGMYFVTNKHRGQFDGAYGGYYGGHWIKVNYPNRYDAARGRAEGLLTPAQEASIRKNWAARAPTAENTKLGGGIGFHGWIKEWDNTGPRHLSWGCVVMHIYDISKLYDLIPPGAMVVIF
ncbi:MAG: peptidoglycan DD-metalloendopeptidase family protein [Blastocatellia bacterium]